MIQKTALVVLVLILLSRSPVFAQGNADSEGGALPLPVGGVVYTLDPQDIEAMQGARMTWIKTPIWLTADTDLAAISSFIEQSHEAGFKVLLTVTGSVTDMETGGATYYPVFASTVGEIAALGPDAIEVWQEMNIAQRWVTGQIDPGAYVALLRLTHAAIKAVNPDIMVITGAIAPNMTEAFFGSDEVWDDDRYYAGMAAAGAADFADCIGIAQTSGATSPFQTTGDPRGDAPIFYFSPAIERAAAPFAEADIPLCFTALGYFSPEGYPDAANFGLPPNSITQQAKWLRDAVLAAEDDGRFALLIVYSIDSLGDVLGAGWAVIRTDGTCPACQALNALAHLTIPEPTAALAPGEEITATIDASTPAVAFTILPADQTQVALRAIPAAGSQLDPILAVYDTAGNRLAFNDDTSLTSLEARIDQIPGGQRLVAVVYAFDIEAGGDFTLSVNIDTSMPGSILGGSNVNIRSTPSTNASILATAMPGMDVQIMGRNADASWLKVVVGDVEGWIASFLLTVEGEINDLPVVE